MSTEVDTTDDDGEYEYHFISPSTDLRDLEWETRYVAEVVNKVPYGVFVALCTETGTMKRVSGLVHKTEFPPLHNTDDYEVGDRVAVTLHKVQSEDEYGFTIVATTGGDNRTWETELNDTFVTAKEEAVGGDSEALQAADAGDDPAPVGSVGNGEAAQESAESDSTTAVSDSDFESADAVESRLDEIERELEILEKTKRVTNTLIKNVHRLEERVEQEYNIPSGVDIEDDLKRLNREGYVFEEYDRRILDGGDRIELTVAGVLKPDDGDDE